MCYDNDTCLRSLYDSYTSLCQFLSNIPLARSLTLFQTCNEFSYDGKIHFLPLFNEIILQKNQIKDNEVDAHIKNHNWTLIRVSYDQFVYSTKIINKVKHDASYFKQECLDEIVRILNSNVPGIYKIGSTYN